MNKRRILYLLPGTLAGLLCASFIDAAPDWGVWLWPARAGAFLMPVAVALHLTRR